MEIINPVKAAIIKGKIKASDVLKGFFISKRMTIKKALVAKVEDEYTSVILNCSLSREKGGVSLHIASQIRCTAR